MRIVAACCLLAICLPTGAAIADAAPLRFAAVDIYLTSNDPIAAWQFELSDRHSAMRVVGIEQGDSKAYDRPPYYDREAVRLGTADRVIVADYSLAGAGELPTGRTRIATIHVTLQGEQSLQLLLVTATDHGGATVDASISYSVRPGSEQ